MASTLNPKTTGVLKDYEEITSTDRKLDAYKSGKKDLYLASDAEHILTERTVPAASLRELYDTTQEKERMPYKVILDTEQNVKDIVTDMISKMKEIIESFDDPIEKQNLFTSFMDDLQTLWGLRKEREEEFAELIVLVESVTKNADPQDFTKEQFEVLKNTAVTFGQPVISRTDLKNCRDRFRGCKLDIYRPLKGNSKIHVTFSEEPKA